MLIPGTTSASLPSTSLKPTEGRCLVCWCGWPSVVLHTLATLADSVGPLAQLDVSRSLSLCPVSCLHPRDRPR